MKRTVIVPLGNSVLRLDWVEPNGYAIGYVMVDGERFPLGITDPRLAVLALYDLVDISGPDTDVVVPFAGRPWILAGKRVGGVVAIRLAPLGGSATVRALDLDESQRSETSAVIESELRSLKRPSIVNRVKRLVVQLDPRTSAFRVEGESATLTISPARRDSWSSGRYRSGTTSANVGSAPFDEFLWAIMVAFDKGPANISAVSTGHDRPGLLLTTSERHLQLRFEHSPHDGSITLLMKQPKASGEGYLVRVPLEDLGRQRVRLDGAMNVAATSTLGDRVARLLRRRL